MPTKRRIILFLVVLAIMLLVKRAVGQELGEAVGWDQEVGLSLESYIEATMIASLVWGSIAGTFRVFARNLAAREGRYFSGDLVCLQL